VNLEQRLVVSTSWGNDSVALVQFLHEAGFTNVICVYCNTGWGVSWWAARVSAMETWAQSLGFQTVEIKTIGMEQLVLDHRGWPRNGMQFCTEDLKIVPFIEWLAEHDPEMHALVCVGVRRAESERRSQIVEFEIEDERAGGRHQWRALYLHSDDERDALILRAGKKVLPHRSKECDPCINGSRKDIAEVEPIKIDFIEDIEQRLGFSRTGKPRVMFRPAKKMGATGIREIVEWAKSAPGKYKKGAYTLDDEAAGNCHDTGYCGG